MSSRLPQPCRSVKPGAEWAECGPAKPPGKRPGEGRSVLVAVPGLMTCSEELRRRGPPWGGGLRPHFPSSDEDRVGGHLPVTMAGRPPRLWPGPESPSLLCPQHPFDGILQWAIQSMSRPLAEAPTFPS